MKKRFIKCTALLMVMAFMFSLVACSSSSTLSKSARKAKATTSENYDIQPLVGTATDYSNVDNWMYYSTAPTEEVDLFYIYPTIVNETDNDDGVSEINAEHKSGATIAFAFQGSAFLDYTNIFAPYYRQIALEKAIELGDANLFCDHIKQHVTRTDIYAALDYYFANANNGRPVLFASHSQGSAVAKIILEEYMKVHPEYLERVVATYAIGFPFSNEWFMNNPHVKCAQGETDTGCVITWNTEGPNATMPSMLIDTTDGVNINPLNWKTDSTLATVAENKGSLIMKNKVSGNDRVTEGQADAQIDTNRHALICTTIVDYPDSSFTTFGDKALHEYDYPAYFMNIRANGYDRITSFLGHSPIGVDIDE